MPGCRTADKPLERRLWSRVDRSGGPDACWPFLGSPGNRGGYGQILVDGHNTPAPRAAWIVANGPIPDGLLVCHRCDNPPCCNPRHLFLGTHADNTADMVEKGRGKRPPALRGVAHPGARLRDEQVKSIRLRLAEGVSQRQIARQYGVSQSQVSHIATGKHWTDV